MMWRNSAYYALDVPREPYNRFTGPRAKTPQQGRFFAGANRQQPYEGWRDRRSGWYRMSHNRHTPES